MKEGGKASKGEREVKEGSRDGSKRRGKKGREGRRMGDE
jgi:hypothetical protein